MSWTRQNFPFGEVAQMLKNNVDDELCASLQKMAAFAEISGAQTKTFQVQVHKNNSSAPKVQYKVISSVLNKWHKLSARTLVYLPPLIIYLKILNILEFYFLNEWP